VRAVLKKRCSPSTSLVRRDLERLATRGEEVLYLLQLRHAPPSDPLPPLGPVRGGVLPEPGRGRLHPLPEGGEPGVPWLGSWRGSSGIGSGTPREGR